MGQYQVFLQLCRLEHSEGTLDMKRLIFLSSLCVSLISSAHQTPDSIKDRYRALYQLPVETLADGSKSFHDAKLLRRGGIYILSLKGDPFEMAFQHGRLLKKEIVQGALPQVAKIVENSVRNVFVSLPFVTDLAIKYLEDTYTESILQSGIEFSGGDTDKTLLEAYGMSEGAEIPLDDVIRGALGPESLQVMLGKQVSGKLLLPSGFPTGMMLKNCTDFAVRGHYTRQGEFIIGRNTDYPLNGSFDRFPTVIYFEPTDSGQKYMAITSAGIHSAGVVGYNESGLFLGVHTIPTKDVSEKGTSIFVLGQHILKHATTFDEAVEFFSRFKPAAGWTYTLVSTRENRMGAVELTHSKVSVREVREDLHAQTNHFVSESMLSENLDLNASINEDTRARRLRVESLANSFKGRFSPINAVQILSDKWDSINQETKGLGNVVAVHTTLSSSVFDPFKGRVFVASGRAPVSLTTYIELPLVDQFLAEDFNSQDFSTIENSNYFIDYPEIAQAEQLYIEAKTAFESELNPLKSYEILKQTTALDPKNAAYSFVEGIMALKANKFGLAQKSFLRLKGLKSHHYRLLGDYYLARIYADQGNIRTAKSHFEKVLAQASPVEELPLLKATQNSMNRMLKRKYLKLNTATLSLFMPEADMVQY